MEQAEQVEVVRARLSKMSGSVTITLRWPDLEQHLLAEEIIQLLERNRGGLAEAVVLARLARFLISRVFQGGARRAE